MTDEITIFPGRSMHRILDLLAEGDASYPAIISHLRIPQPMTISQRKKLNRKLSILTQKGFIGKVEAEFCITPEGEAELDRLGPVLPPGASVRVFGRAAA